MASDNQVGNIVYQVQMDVKNLLVAQQEVDKRLGKLEGGFNKTSASVQGTEKAFSSLSKVAASLTAYLSISAVANYADAWTQLNNKLANSIKLGETLAEVNQRVFDIAQESRSSLEGIATLYSRMERAMRDAGVSGKELGQITTTISKAMTISGATAAESEGALIQLSQALASGVLRGQEFNSMSEQAPALMKGISDSLGVNIGKLRAMAAEGKLTTEVLLKAFRDMAPTIEKEFANTITTMSQALTTASNNITKFFGESTSAQTGLKIFNETVISLSENIGAMGIILTATAALMGGRYAGSLFLASKKKLELVVASHRQSQASYEAAKAAKAEAAQQLATAQAEKVRITTHNQWMSTQSVINKQMGLNVSYQKEYEANFIRIKQLDQQMAASKLQLAAATEKASIANRAYSASMSMAKGALGLVGGPAGAAMIAASAIFYFYQKTEQARQEAASFADSLDSLTSKMKEMNKIQLEGQIATATKHLATYKDEISDLEGEIKSLNEQYVRAGEQNYSLAGIEKKRAEILNEIKIKTADLDTKTNEYSRTLSSIGLMNAQLNGALKQGAELLQNEGNILPTVGDAWRSYGLDIDGATKSKQAFNAESLKVQWSDKGADLKKQLEREIEAANAPNEVAKRKLLVSYYAEDNNLSEQETGKLKDLAGVAAEASEAKKTSAKETKSATTASDAAADAIKRQNEELSRLNTGYKEGSIEMAKYDAVNRLGSNATSIQIEKAEQLAVAIHEVMQAQENQRRAEQGRDFAKGVINDSRSPLEQIDVESQAKLQKISEYQALDLENAQLYEDAKTAIEEQASMARQKILDEEAMKRTQAISDMLGAASQGFDGMAGIAKAAAGEQSGAYRALFAVSKAFAIAQSAINFQTALSNALAIPWPANIPAIAQATAAGGQIASTIAGINYGGARKDGGPVSAGSMYRVGEQGKPEIFKANNGNQYMIPGDNGKVISNKSLGKGAGGISMGDMHFSFNVQAPNGITQKEATQISNLVTNKVYEVLRTEMRDGGALQNSRPW